MAGRVEQVDHGEHRVQPVRQLGRAGHAVRDPGGGDLLLGPGDPGRHGRLGHQERLRDLSRGQAAHQPQRQRHLCLPGQGGMAAGEYQAEPVVGDHVLPRVPGVPRLGRVAGRLPRSGGRAGLDQQRQLGPQGPVPALRVQRPPSRGRGQPGAGIARYALPGPGVERGHVRILNALLGDVDVTGDARRRGEHEGPLATVRVRDGRADLRVRHGPGPRCDLATGPPGHPMPDVSMIGRTSTPPNGAGQSLAISRAWSRSRASIR